MNRTFKIIASRGAEIIFDDRIQAETPRMARDKLKDRLGLGSLRGIVYTITEIPVDLIREIVDARIAELAGGELPRAAQPVEIDHLLDAKLQPLLARLMAIEQRPAARVGPARFDPLRQGTGRPVIDWPAVRRYFEAGHSVRQTAEHFDMSMNTVKTRLQREGWTR